jgi:hypothetical protein
MQFSAIRRSSSTLLQTFVISILFLAACSPLKSSQSEIWDSSLMASNPCPAPCFYGIEPGITTLSEAEDLLQAAGYCLDPSYIRSSSPTEPESLFCENWIFVGSDSGKEITRDVSFYAPNQLTVNMVVNQIGYPDAVMIDAFIRGEEEWSYMNLYYLKGFTRLILPDQIGADYRIEKETEVDRVIYYEEGFFTELYDDTSPWSGYGVYPPDF